MTALSPGAALVWFRDDLRIADNPALTEAVRSGKPLVCAFVLDEDGPGLRALGGATRWWLAGSLRALSAALDARGAALVLRRGPALTVIPALAAEAGADLVLWNRRYDLAGRSIDDAVAQRLKQKGRAVETFQANLLYEPGSIVTRAGDIMRVFTPFWRAACGGGELRQPHAAPKRLRTGKALASDALADWGLEPVAPDWAGGLRETWVPGEAGAAKRLASFLDDDLAGYAQGRDRPDLDRTSRLSPHLRFGEISPFQIWHAARMASDAPRGRPAPASDVEKLMSELGWREFSHHLLSANPDLAFKNLQSRFDAFPWRKDKAALRAWQRGCTGYPIIDAGMRQLWRSGWMHNRVRMIVASFLVKHLLIDWRDGEAWFWDTLVDADPANNPASWQWVAGSGADAAPYFRIFNPILQGEKFDPSGDYVRRFVPELGSLPVRFIHQPWNASPVELEAAGVTLGGTYPEPVVDHAAARERALAAFARTKPRS